MWAIKLPAYVEANNDSYSSPVQRSAPAVAGSDQLTIRRASTQVDRNRRAAHGQRGTDQAPDQPRAGHAVFERDAVPAGYLPPLSETRALDRQRLLRRPGFRRARRHAVAASQAARRRGQRPGDRGPADRPGRRGPADRARRAISTKTRTPTISCSRTPPSRPATRSSRSACGCSYARSSRNGVHGRPHLRLCEPHGRHAYTPADAFRRRARQQDHRTQEHTSMNRTASGFQRQQGAALVVGLILLLVLTILAVSGVFTSTMELRMVRNTQSQERAFQAAEVGDRGRARQTRALDQRRVQPGRHAVPNSDPATRIRTSCSSSARRRSAPA